MTAPKYGCKKSDDGEHTYDFLPRAKTDPYIHLRCLYCGYEIDKSINDLPHIYIDDPLEFPEDYK
ncbi:MAG: hypothetical protein ACR2KF_08510 [Nitrososphaeraceae archaeon]